MWISISAHVISPPVQDQNGLVIHSILGYLGLMDEVKLTIHIGFRSLVSPAFFPLAILYSGQRLPVVVPGRGVATRGPCTSCVQFWPIVSNVNRGLINSIGQVGGLPQKIVIQIHTVRSWTVVIPLFIRLVGLWLLDRHYGKSPQIQTFKVLLRSL